LHKRGDLINFPIAIVTHKSFMLRDSYGFFMHQGKRKPRALVVIDEYLEDITINDVQLSAMMKLQEDLQKHERNRECVLPHVDAFVSFMLDRKDSSRRNLEKAEDDPAVWQAVIKELQWFASEEAQRYLRGRGEEVRAIFGFARAVTRGRPIIERKQEGELGIHFVGYEGPRAPRAGMVLLDATAKTHGIAALCPRQELVDVPEADYLELVHVAPPHKERQLKRHITASAENAGSYQGWMLEVISKYVDPGQKALIVCDKWPIEHHSIPNWDRKDARWKDRRLFEAQWGWNLDGRQLCVTNWGNGVGENAWAEAEVVLLQAAGDDALERDAEAKAAAAGRAWASPLAL